MHLATYCLAALLTSASLAQAQQTAPNAAEAIPRPAATTPTGTTVIQPVASTPQKWASGVEIECRGPRELVGSYMTRLNSKLKERGEAGWELVSIAIGPDLGFAKSGATDCLVVALKRPLATIRD